MTSRGDVCWADFGEPRGSAPGYRRPVVVISADRFNASRLRTVTVAVITSNTDLARAPGNVLIDSGTAGLDRDSVVVVSSLYTLDQAEIERAVGQLPLVAQREVDRGLRLALSL